MRGEFPEGGDERRGEEREEVEEDGGNGEALIRATEQSEQRRAWECPVFCV
jgi:hypothetical protein